MYRVGFPGWKIAARLGAPLSIRIDLFRDKEAGVYVATSPDLPGLVVESASLDASLDVLHKDLDDCVDMMLEEILSLPPKHPPRADLRMQLGCFAAA